MAIVGTIKRRKPWLAALLSFVTTGLGQFYVGNWQRGLMLLGIEMVVGAILAFNMGSLLMLVVGGSALIFFNIYVAVDAYLSGRRAGEYALKPCNRWWVYALLIASNMAFGSMMEFAPYETYKVPSGSMLNTLRIGDHFMAELLDQEDLVERGEVIIFLYPEDRTKNYVKRVVGLPGDTVELRDSVVFVNGESLHEPYTFHKNKEAEPRVANMAPVTLSEDEFFVLGDNRQGSHDSRFFGPILREDIVARALYLYFPAGDWDRWGKKVR